MSKTRKYNMSESMEAELRELLNDALNNKMNVNNALVRTLAEVALHNRGVMKAIMTSEVKIAVKDYVSELLDRDVFRISTATNLYKKVAENVDVEVSKNTFYRAVAELSYDNPRYLKRYRIGNRTFYVNIDTMSDQELALLDDLCIMTS